MPRLWSILVLLATAAFVAGPFLTPGFGGFEPGQFPVPQEDPPVQPAGYAFAIWGLIYTWLAISAVFGVFSRGTDVDWQDFRPALFVSLVAGAAWLWVATLSVIAATLLIWIMLVSALEALFKTGATDRWLQQAPVAIYAGWLTAASCVSVGLVLAGYGFTNQINAAIIALVLALVISCIVQYALHRAPEYGYAVIWALVAVIVQNVAPFNIVLIGLSVLGILALLALRLTDTE
ncbi:hypothetical protein [Pseudaestuariivita sp.]|uniref:hypothetical protein n=1 Tax=Pseudaestuariivita sp. TaxID=2211669 RepID=UPI004059BC95